MKTKHLIITIGVLTVLLIYNIFCYRFVNKNIATNTNKQIKDYFKKVYQKEIEYNYIRATLNSDETINVYIKTTDSNEYYNFIFEHNLGYYLIKVNKNIPAFITN